MFLNSFLVVFFSWKRKKSKEFKTLRISVKLSNCQPIRQLMALKANLKNDTIVVYKNAAYLNAWSIPFVKGFPWRQSISDKTIKSVQCVESCPFAWLTSADLKQIDWVQFNRLIRPAMWTVNREPVDLNTGQLGSVSSEPDHNSWNQYSNSLYAIRVFTWAIQIKRTKRLAYVNQMAIGLWIGFFEILCLQEIRTKPFFLKQSINWGSQWRHD